jgi:hypothetical protein
MQKQRKALDLGLQESEVRRRREMGERGEKAAEQVLPVIVSNSMFACIANPETSMSNVVLLYCQGMCHGPSGGDNTF